MSESLGPALQDALFTIGIMDSDSPTRSSIENELLLIQQREEYNNSIISQWIQERQGMIHELQSAQENVAYRIVEVGDSNGGKHYVFSEHPGPGFDNW